MYIKLGLNVYKEITVKDIPINSSVLHMDKNSQNYKGLTDGFSDMVKCEGGRHVL